MACLWKRGSLPAVALRWQGVILHHSAPELRCHGCGHRDQQGGSVGDTTSAVRCAAAALSCRVESHAAGRQALSLHHDAQRRPATPVYRRAELGRGSEEIAPCRLDERACLAPFVTTCTLLFRMDIAELDHISKTRIAGETRSA